MAKYIVVRFIKGSKRIQKTNWTDSNAIEPVPLPRKKAEAALAFARETWPSEVYELLKVEE